MRLILSLLLLLTIPLAASNTIVVGIAGGTGSGKTTLAQRLLHVFSDRAVLINQDSYYKDLSHLDREERAKQNFDHPLSIDFALLREHVLQLKENRPIKVPIYNFCTHSREPATQTVEPASIVILEGILLFALPEIRELCDLKIFVDTGDDVRLLRRIERDISERARDFASIRDQYLATVKPMHDAFVEPSKRHADVIIPTFQPNDNALNIIVSSLKADLDFLAQREQTKRR